MPGISLLTNLDAMTTAATVRRVARELGFTVTEVGDWEVELSKGSLATSLILGALVAYCRFRVTFRPRPDNTVEVLLERNSPWVWGTMGVNRVKAQANDLADAIEKALREQRA